MFNAYLTTEVIGVDYRTQRDIFLRSVDMVLTLTAIKYNILITVTGNELLDLPLQFSFAHWQLSSAHFTFLY